MTMPRAELFWRSPRAVRAARRLSLQWARAELARRLAAGAGTLQVFGEAHDGANHVRFFREEFPTLLAHLPAGFRAFEAGAGMGWHAAMLAARGAGAVVAGEIMWQPGQTPFSAANASTLRRIASHDAELAGWLRLEGERPDFRGRLLFVGSSAEHIPLSDQSVHLVYTYNCLEHIVGLSEFCAEAARVLRHGGVFFNATEPLYFSPFGHHLWDIFPAPWGHLLWEAEEFAELAVREAGPREWAPDVPLAAAHLLDLLRHGLNHARPRDIRAALRPGPWRILGWRELGWHGNRDLARRLSLGEALRGLHADDLFLTGLRLRLRRSARPVGWRLPLRLAASTRMALRAVLGRRGS